MKLKILVTAGDGIGPEVTNEAVAVLREVAELDDLFSVRVDRLQRECEQRARQE